MFKRNKKKFAKGEEGKLKNSPFALLYAAASAR